MLNTDEVAPLSLDPDRLTIIQLANAEQQISLPWFPKPVTIGTMFHSKLSGTPNPFGHPHESPFDTESLENSKLVYHADSAESTFRAVETKTKLTTKDHLGLSLGVTVGNSFLNANVTGRYDKEVRENTDTVKKSIHTQCQYGSLKFDRPPRLSKSALITLKHQGGIEAFKRQYGDYYVSGYRIGGETGTMVSTRQHQKSELEDYSITASTKLFLFTVSKTWSMIFTESCTSSTITVTSYDTLDSRNISFCGFGGDKNSLEKLYNIANETEMLGQNLWSRVQEKMKPFDLFPYDTTGLGVCKDICLSGLVTELYLTPVRSLREVMVWGKNDNCI